MATPLGYFEIHEVKDNCVKGFFKSISMQNVCEADKEIAAIVLFEAWERFGEANAKQTYSELLKQASETFETSELIKLIDTVSFDKPNSTETNFEFAVTDKRLILFLGEGKCKLNWESYYWG